MIPPPSPSSTTPNLPPSFNPNKPSQPSTTTTTTSSSSSLSGDNESALRAAASSLSLSRSVLSTTLSQSEQLERSHDLMERQKYVMEKSSRLVRGMTWSGWMKNLVSKDVAPPDTTTGMRRTVGRTNDGGGGGSVVREEDNRGLGSTGRRAEKEVSGFITGMEQRMEEMEGMEDLSSDFRQLNTTVKNYHCNVLLLRQCTNQTQFETCLDVCRALSSSAHHSIANANDVGHDGIQRADSDSGQRARNRQFFRRIKLLLKEAEALQSDAEREISKRFAGSGGEVGGTRVELGLKTPLRQRQSPRFKPFPTYDIGDDDNALQKYAEQEQHLSLLSSDLEELRYMGGAVGSTLREQNEFLDAMEGKAEDVIDRTKMAVRQSERIQHRSFWTYPKSDFKGYITVQHLPSSKYLTVLPSRIGYSVCLSPDFRSDAAVFGLYARRKSETTLGLLNKCANRWLGQSMLMGELVCKGTRFGYREEWELDHVKGKNGEEFELGDPIAQHTKILCCSANGGRGGWLQVDETIGSGRFEIGTFDAEAKKKAPLWSIAVLEDDVLRSGGERATL